MNRFLKPKPYLIFLIIHSFNNLAQDTLKTASLEVELMMHKIWALQKNKNLIIIDSNIKQYYHHQSMVNLLSEQTPGYIKQYGAGNIANISIRGSNASQSSILWNGLNIQNAALGQNDISLLPSFLFENVMLELGGNSSFNGSSAMGGSVLLFNQLKVNKAVSVFISQSIGSFSAYKTNIQTQFVINKTILSLKMYHHSSLNNFNYIYKTGNDLVEKEMHHSAYNTQGILGEINYLTIPQHTINVRVWYNKYDREIPKFDAILSHQNQIDESFKTNIEWAFQRGIYASNLKTGYFYDVLIFIDLLANINSTNYQHTYIADQGNTLKFKTSNIYFGTTASMYQSKHTNQYNHQLNKLAFFAAFDQSMFQSKLNYNVAVRKEISSLLNNPFTTNIGLSYVIHPKLKLNTHFSNSFRQPTLNDLYWTPGGNPNLMPEEAYEWEASANATLKVNQLEIQFKPTYFIKKTANWIMWLPSNGLIWSPKNILEVNTTGIETSSHIKLNLNNFKINVGLNTLYCLSINKKSLNPNDESVGKQLVYTPLYSGQSTINMIYKAWSVLISQSYTGYVYTNTDNSNWLNPYYLLNFKTQHHFNFYKTVMCLQFEISNFLNQSYTVMNGRPMPLRSFELSIAMRY